MMAAGCLGSNFGAGLANERGVAHTSHSNKIYEISKYKEEYIS